MTISLDGSGLTSRRSLLLHRPAEKIGDPAARRMIAAERDDRDGDRDADEGAEQAPKVSPQKTASNTTPVGDMASTAPDTRGSI